jgi:hypothetical protein
MIIINKVAVGNINRIVNNPSINHIIHTVNQEVMIRLIFRNKIRIVTVIISYQQIVHFVVSFQMMILMISPGMRVEMEMGMEMVFSF